MATGESERRSADRSSSSARQQGVIVRLLSWLAFSLVLSIALEWIGMAVLWPESGAAHSREVLAADRRYVGELAASRLLDQVRQDVSQDVIAYLEPKRILPRVPATPAWLRQFRSSIATDPWRESAANVSLSMLYRLQLLLAGLPLIMLLAVLGLTDGLVQRDLRRWRGGRESAFIYHLAKRNHSRALIIAATLYLAAPVAVHPLLVILPAALIYSLTAMIMASRFKKYI